MRAAISTVTQVVGCMDDAQVSDYAARNIWRIASIKVPSG